MSVATLYLDEDVQASALIEALRARGLDVLTTSEAGRSNSTDEEQLAFATLGGRVLISCNIADFARLHYATIEAGREHAGIILIRQQKWGPGELARRIVRLLAAVPNHSMRNRLEFISGW